MKWRNDGRKSSRWPGKKTGAIRAKMSIPWKMESPSMIPGDFYLATFPFAGKVGAKMRPVLALTGPLGPVPEFLVAYISSVIPASLLPSDIMLDPANPDHASTGLKNISLL